MTAPDRDVTITFVSVPCKTKADGWRVKITFPANAGAEDKLLLECFDGTEVPLDEGTFDFAGRRTAFKGGRADMRYADFIAGMRDTAVWFARPGDQHIPGYLTFA